MSLSSYDSGYSSAEARLDYFSTQMELARNFYDDVEFCPVAHFDQVDAHRDRIQQRSPYASPKNSPPLSYHQALYGPSSPDSSASSCAAIAASMASSSQAKRRAIPIINPESMTPVAFLHQHPHHPQHQQHQLAPHHLPAAAWSSNVIPIINPSTGLPLSPYDVTVR
ncbi:hypothetical protein BC940DRAFT_293543 [Gongronella butleri]|nr:hypothetical protein BC940DRAFT_293543 [Gongronella butleri]